MSYTLIPSMGPLQDKIISRSGNIVVLFSDQYEIGLLSYEADKKWYIHGYQSVAAATGTDIEGASLYYRGNGYIGTSEITYGCFIENTSMYMWDRLYDDIGAKPLSVEEETEDLFRLFTSIAPVAIFHTDPMGALIYMNKRWEEITGLKSEECFNHRWLTFVHAEDRPGIIEVFKEAVEHQQHIKLEFRVLSDGSFRWLRLEGVVQSDETGEINGYIGIAIDITSKQEYANELERCVQLRTEELVNAESSLRDLVLGTSHVGKEFFSVFVECLAESLKVRYTIIAEKIDNNTFRTLAFWDNQKKIMLSNLEYEIKNTLYERSINLGESVNIKYNVQELYPHDQFLKKYNLQSFLSVPITDQKNMIVGHISALDDQPVCQGCSCIECRAVSIVAIFAARAASEMSRLRAESQILESKNLLQSVMNCIPDGIIAADKNGKFLVFNPAAEKLTGQGPLDIPIEELAEAYNIYLTDGVTPCPYEQLPLVRAMTGEQVNRSELMVITPDGQSKLLSVNASLIYDNGGGICVLRDITESRKTENRYKSIVEDSIVLICRFTPDKKLTFVNAAYCECFGKTTKELVGISFLTLIPEEYHQQVIDHFVAFTVDNPFCSQEHEVITSIGERRWQHWRSSAFFNHSGQIIEYQSIGIDITEEKNARAIKEQLDIMSDLYDNAPDIFISVEVPSGNVVKCNHKTTNVLGYSKEEVIGKQATELYHEYSESAAAAAFEKFKINGEVSVDYLLLKHKNGHGIAVSLNASAVKDDQGNICYSRSILRELDQ